MTDCIRSRPTAGARPTADFLWITCGKPLSHNDTMRHARCSGVGPMSEETTEQTAKRARGFAAMTPDQRRALGSKGGRVAHERGNANKFTSDSASAAGRIPHERGTAYRWTSEEARAAAKKGAGISRRRRRSAPPDAA